MQFVYHPKSGEEILEIEGEVYNYLFKVRRHKKNERVAFRNLKDGFLYFYDITEVSRKRALLTLVHREKKEIMPKKSFHLIWCVVDPKTVEKTLPMLNEIGVGKITFVYCDRSQRNFKIKPEKLQKILINSCQQCGRSSLMEISFAKNLSKIIKETNNIVVLDFSEKRVKNTDNIENIVVGPEGGFSEKERELFRDLKVLGLDTETVLRSETAALAVSMKVLL